MSVRQLPEGHGDLGPESFADPLAGEVGAYRIGVESSGLSTGAGDRGAFCNSQ